MWLVMAAETSAALVRLLTQEGSWLCQTSVWPLTFILFCCAKLTTWSAGPKVNVPRDASVASHFISFSGVTKLNSFAVLVKLLSERRGTPTATPISLPVQAPAAWRFAGVVAQTGAPPSREPELAAEEEELAELDPELEDWLGPAEELEPELDDEFEAGPEGPECELDAESDPELDPELGGDPELDAEPELEVNAEPAFPEDDPELEGVREPCPEDDADGAGDPKLPPSSAFEPPLPVEELHAPTSIAARIGE